MGRRGEVLRFELPPAAVVNGLTGPATGVHRLVGRPPTESTATVIDTPDRRLLTWGLELPRDEVEALLWLFGEEPLNERDSKHYLGYLNDAERGGPGDLSPRGLRRVVLRQVRAVIDHAMPDSGSHTAAMTVYMATAEGRLALEGRYAALPGAGENAVFFESFYGQSSGCNPGAIDRELAARAPGVTRYWSVVDLSIPVPEGAIPLAAVIPQAGTMPAKIHLATEEKPVAPDGRATLLVLDARPVAGQGGDHS